MDTPPNITADDIVKDLDFMAKEFAFLLTKSDLDDETQSALMEALPYLELEQLVDLVSVLEAKQTTLGTEELDLQLENNLNKIGYAFTSRQQARDENLLKELEALDETLN